MDALVDRTAPAVYGLAALDRDSGQLLVGRDGTVPLFAASVVKLLTAVAVMDRAENGSLTLSSGQTELLRRSLRESNDSTMSRLWGEFGGPSIVTDVVQLVGLCDTRPPGRSGQWGETLVSARDVVAVYQYVLSEMGEDSGNMIMDSLSAADASGASGFDQGFGLLARPTPPRWRPSRSG